MTVLIAGSQLRVLELGTKVDKAAAALPATATGTLFTVSGGRIWVTSIVGLVATNIQAQANAIKLVATPTTGSANDLCGTVDINGLAAGGLVSFTGLIGDAAVKSTGGGISTLRNPILVAVGTIGLNTAATNTGTMSWSITYVPYDDGASVA